MWLSVGTLAWQTFRTQVAALLTTVNILIVKTVTECSLQHREVDPMVPQHTPPQASHSLGTFYLLL